MADCYSTHPVFLTNDSGVVICKYIYRGKQREKIIHAETWSWIVTECSKVKRGELCSISIGSLSEEISIVEGKPIVFNIICDRENVLQLAGIS